MSIIGSLVILNETILTIEEIGSLISRMRQGEEIPESELDELYILNQRVAKEALENLGS